MINIAEILRRCPIGTELFCSILGPCKLYNISETNGSIIVQVDDGAIYVFTQEGKLPLSNAEIALAECILFPSKEDRDWSKFEQSLLAQYSTETLRAELKRRSAEEKAMRQKEFISAHRCRNCKFFEKEPNSFLSNSHICMARTWGKTTKRHYVVNGSHGLQCKEFIHK